jgi:ppGpp synthetase/RelA/SpoT-type nucleotidyltranferase
MDSKQQKNKFEEVRPNFEKFRVDLDGLVKKLCCQIQVNAQIDSRTKTVSSFESKINRPGKSYFDPLNELTDLVGVRVVVDTLAEVDQVVEILRKEFTIDEENSVNKSELLDADKFGYLSQHLIVKVSDRRTALLEWSGYKSISAEIQVRTALQHTWSVVQHPLDYKSALSVPKALRRRLFRLSALFELADAELDQIMVEAKEIRATYNSKDSHSFLDLPIDKESLEMYIRESHHFKYWDHFINSIPGLQTEKPNWGPRDVEMARFCGLKTLGDFEDILKNNIGWWENFAVKNFKGSSSLTQNGILLYSLFANFPDILTKEKMRDSFGFMQPDKAFNLALELNPKFNESNSI